MVKEDFRNDDNFIQQQESNEEALFCTICKTEVRKFSKHCKSCDKCVDGFDHHCRWLNNCVGRKKYITFLLLMASNIAWLAVECGVGIAIFVRCFKHNSTIKMQIHDRLGDGVSIIPLAIIVGICTVFSFIALIPIGELFFFHIILIRKGITTYEYMVAMRTESEPRGPSINEDQHSPLTSLMSSIATAISGNSLGLQHRGAWCTPPRIFMDNQNCPKQPGGHEGGYVVMRYMKEIIQDSERTFVSRWSTKNRAVSYSRTELDEVRFEALNHIEGYM